MKKETREERFHRLAEARTNKAIHMIRLIGNLSNSSYSYPKSKAEQIIRALRKELDIAELRLFGRLKKKKVRFTLEHNPEEEKMLDSPVHCSLRDNLLVTIGSRAAYMDSAGHIELPDSAYEEDELALFAAKLADDYIKDHPDESFDKFIEAALGQRFPKECQ